ncbi:MAG: two pore domain potassium channel family protein, partial [Rhodobacteraceae bacterium]|nr:two pore domain potassium channel family protein [Paracoccaceae bacterium]
MFVQIALGTALMLLSVMVSGLAFWAFEVLLVRHLPWLIREPHRPKLALVLAVAAIWVLGMVTAGVWIWAIALWA